MTTVISNITKVASVSGWYGYRDAINAVVTTAVPDILVTKGYVPVVTFAT